MARIVQIPEADFPNWEEPSKDWAEYDRQQNESLDKLEAHDKSLPDDVYEGRLISFPVGDGQALYRIRSLKPVVLEWVPFQDRWQESYANRLTAKDVKEAADRRRGMAKLFGGFKGVA